MTIVTPGREYLENVALVAASVHLAAGGPGSWPISERLPIPQSRLRGDFVGWGVLRSSGGAGRTRFQEGRFRPGRGRPL